MKDGVEEILGKTIVGVIIKKKTTGSICTTSCIRFNSMQDIYSYMDPAMKVFYQSIKDPDSESIVTSYVNR